MAYSLLITLFACLCAASLAVQNASNVNIAFDYETLDTVKTAVVQPLITRLIKNISIPANVSTKIGSVDLFVNNIVILDVNMDWPNSRLLEVEKDGNPAVMLKDVAVYIQFDCKVKFGFIKESGVNNTMNITLDVDLELGFASIRDIFFGFIANQNVPVKHLNLDLKGGLGKVIHVIEKAFGSSIDKVVAGIIHDKINDANKTIVNITSQPIVVNATPPIEIHGALVNFPQLVYTTWLNQNRTMQTINLDVEAWKNGAKFTPPGALDVLPNIYPDFEPMQIVVSQEILQVAIWTVFQTSLTDKIEVMISNKDLPPGSPISLNTSNLTDLVPDAVKDFGPNKGVYLNFTKGGVYPTANISNGQIGVEVSVILDAFVDEDSTNYPEEGLKNCTACKRALTLNVTSSLSVNAYKVAPLTVGLQILDANLPALDVMFGKVDGEDMRSKLNAMAKSLVEKINEALKDGVKLPKIVQEYGLNDTNIKIDTDRVVIGGDFTVPNRVVAIEI